MSVEEQNNIIRLKVLKKPDEERGRLKSPVSSKNNLINFSNLRAKTSINQTESVCENEQAQKVVSHRDGARALDSKQIIGKVVSNIIHPPVDFWTEGEEANKSDPSSKGAEKSGFPGGGDGSPPPAKESKKWNYIGMGAVCGLCLMMIGFPFMNQKNNQRSRGLASPDSSVLPVQIVKADGSKYRVRLHEDVNRDLSMRLSEEEVGRSPDSAIKTKGFWSVFSSADKNPSSGDADKFKKIIRRQETEALRLIRTGQRRISSVGQKPGVKDVFSIRLLKSRYDLRWKRNRLIYAKLLPNQDPVFVPDMAKVFSQYRLLFPSYVHVIKLKTQNDGLNNDVYELKNAKGLNTARVEVKKDEKGGILSIQSF